MMRDDLVGDKRSGGPFWRGLLLGLSIPVMLIALGAGWVSSKGLVVGVDAAPLKARLGQEVRLAIKQELPHLLTSLKSEVPAQVAAETSRRIGGLQMDLGGFVFEMPPSLVQQVEEAVDQALRIGLDATLRQVDLESLADRLGDRAAELAEARLEESLQAQRLTVEPIPGFQVPVRLRLR